MHSMHVDAFFEYLIGRASPYWTEIPAPHIPVAELEREGVAAEDDMALRALLPQIKPRRGRRKPEDDEASKSPSRRPSPQADDYAGSGRHDGAEPWTAQPDGRGSVFLFPPVPDSSRLNPSGPSWTNGDIVQTPLTAYPIPQSAITPSTRNQFWADEPKSAITPSKARSSSRRHGAKVVSSAWRSGGLGGGGKTRGRPPVNRGAHNEGPFSAFPTSDAPVFMFPPPVDEKDTALNGAAVLAVASHHPTTSAAADQCPPIQPPPTSHPQPGQNGSHPPPAQEDLPPRPAKRSRLSLQVPERVGGEVRLATPPLPPEQPTLPVVMVNGRTTNPPSDPGKKMPYVSGANAINTFNSQAVGGEFPPPEVPSAGTPQVFSRDPTDRTNMDLLEAHFVTHVLSAEWYDAQHNRVPVCSVDEAWAFSQRVIENLMRSATTNGEFLLNLAALAGGHILMYKGSLRIVRLEELADRTRYRCSYQLRFGDIMDEWSMEETVMHDTWKKTSASEEQWRADATRGKSAPPNGAGGPPGPEYWEHKYKELAASMMERDREMVLLRGKVVESIRKF